MSTKKHYPLIGRLEWKLPGHLPRFLKDKRQPPRALALRSPGCSVIPLRAHFQDPPPHPGSGLSYFCGILRRFIGLRQGLGPTPPTPSPEGQEPWVTSEHKATVTYLLSSRCSAYSKDRAIVTWRTLVLCYFLVCARAYVQVHAFSTHAEARGPHLLSSSRALHLAF